ncbi:MAG: hybrid sensor histidine kinase/response regulator, partial [Gemmatimonadales bacterium]
ALGDRVDRLRGMAAGANDYLVKPIDRIEVSLRVRNAVRLRVMHRTVQRQLAELRRLERLRDDLVSMVAHDLRSPLTGLRGLLELLQEGARDRPPSAVIDLLPDAVRTVDEINGMIGDMLDVSRLEDAALPLEWRAADLQVLASEAVARLGPRPSFHPVTVIVDSAPAPVSCDASLIRRVIVNLVANAVRFSPSNGTVRVTAGPLDGGALLRVRDEGPGIPAAEQERIFEKFTQLAGARAARSRSSGLGLTFCRMVIEAHGGRIGVTSGDVGGSEFWFSLPAARPQPDDSAMK